MSFYVLVLKVNFVLKKSWFKNFVVLSIQCFLQFIYHALKDLKLSSVIKLSAVANMVAEIF